MLKPILFDRGQRLRNGWWLLIYAVLLFGGWFVLGLAGRTARALGIDPLWMESVAFVVVLLATWICTGLRGEPLASVGFALDRRWVREFAWGNLVGIGAMLAIVGLMWIVGGVRFELDPARSQGLLAKGLAIFLFVALFEEALFRGFAFQRLVAGTGAGFAQFVVAALFALVHWGNPDMQGAVKVWATVDIALASVMLGLAYLRTRSLALPIGIHLGWNWMQGYVLGFDVSGVDQHGWLQPVLLDRPDWLTGGAFGPESTLLATAVELLVVVLLWRWPASALPPRAHASVGAEPS